jgi:hypothetical protein
VPGDEVITVQAGSPTTVNPILRNRLVPVFVDVELGTHSAVPFRARLPRRSADAADRPMRHRRGPGVPGE